MEIASTTQAQITAAPTPATEATGAQDAGGMITSDFTTFLKMLTTQMENQDPLNPMESTDFAVQLATFSGVEQQVQTNDLLTAMGAQLGSMNMSNLAAWVGMEARAVAPVWFGDSPVTLQPDPATGAERAFLVVRDAAGSVVDRVEVPVSDETVQWAGVSATGDPFAPGVYSFHLQSFARDKILAETQVAAFSEIVEARLEDGRTVLVLEGGAEVPAAEVDGLRRPSTEG
jgi:flagellar basal-body rod modification protein FlgD